MMPPVKKQILVADDEDQVRFTLNLILKQAGYEVITAKDGLQALLKIEEGCRDEHLLIDLLILDIQMPYLTGLELLDKLEEKGIHIPALVISGHGDKKIVIELLSKGCLGYIDKPFDRQELLERISVAFKKAQRIQKIQEKGHYYHSIAETIDGGVYVLAPDNTIAFVNDRMCKLLGYKNEDFQGKPLVNFMDEEGQKIAEEYFQNYTKNYRLPHSLKFINKNQNHVWVMASAKPFIAKSGQYSGAMIVATDITQTKWQQEQKYKMLSIAVEQSHESIIILNGKGDIEYVNPAFERIFEFSFQEIFGKKISVVLEVPFGEILEDVALDGLWKKCLKVKEHEVNATISPVYDEFGNILNYVSIVQDISVQAKWEKELYKSKKQEALGNMARGIAHDFNNICCVIKGYAELISTRDPMSQEYVKNIVSACLMTENLVKQIYDFSSDAHKQKDLVDLVKIIKDSIALVNLSRPLGVNVRMHLDVDKTFILAHAPQITQVIVNICNNAMESIEDKGFLDLGCSMVFFREKLSKNENSKFKPYAMITVTDTGCGMDEEVKEKIFEPFFTKNKEKGTGIGLATVYKIVKEHQGFIKVYSKPGKGTTFAIFLPLEEQYSDISQLNLLFKEFVRPSTILVASADKRVVEKTAIILSQQGHKIVEVDNGDEVVELFQTFTFDMLVVDANLPGSINTSEICQFIRKDPYGVLLPIVIVGEKKEDFTSNATKTFVKKPFSSPRFICIVNNLLTKSLQYFNTLSSFNQPEKGDILKGDEELYKIEKVLDKGGMGIVFYGHRFSDSKPVAIKVLQTAILKEHKNLQRFWREANLLLKIKHPHLVKGMEMVHYDNHFFLIMEYVAGNSLLNLVREQGKMEYIKAIEVIIQVAKGLDYLHQQGFVHRDVKPGNVIITPEEKAILVDMGLAKEDIPRSNITTQYVLGSPLYMSPEQTFGMKAHPTSDIYSLGITFCFMIAACVPFEGGDTIEIMANKSLNQVFEKFLLDLNVDKKILKVIQKMTEIDPSERYQNCQDLISDLENLTF